MDLPAPVRAAVERLLGWHRVATARAVMTRYGEAGGALLAGGLTYAALFALLPALLLLVALLGFVVEDPGRRTAIIDAIGTALPPLRDFLEASLDELVGGAPAYGALGLVGLAWGASRFYGALDEAFARIFSGVPKRGFVARTVRGILSVGLVLIVFLVALALTGVASLLADRTAGRFGSLSFDVWAIAAPLLAAAVLVVGTLVIYRIVPARRVTWRAGVPPALLVGAAIALLTQLFSYIAPRLVGTAALFGTFVAVFAAMVWMSVAFQVLLVGAAWVRERLGPGGPAFLEDA
jgi:membrane protein